MSKLQTETIKELRRQVKELSKYKAQWLKLMLRNDQLMKEIKALKELL